MTSTDERIRRLWDEGRLTSAEIAAVTGCKEAYVSRVVSEHVERKALERRKERAAQ